jgi:hypothetical protein
VTIFGLQMVQPSVATGYLLALLGGFVTFQTGRAVQAGMYTHESYRLKMRREFRKTLPLPGPTHEEDDIPRFPGPEKVIYGRKRSS